MKSILVIGMGRFGKHLSRKLIELGNDVMVVDRNEENLTELLPIATNAQIGDCTNEDVLRSLGVNNFDICFVCVGTNFQSSLEITSLLKDLGAKHVISKATRDIQVKFLLRNGADEVVYPDRDVAEKLAVLYSANSLYDYFELSRDVSVYEILPLESWIGKSLKGINFRAKYHANILAIKAGENVFMPTADYVFKADEHVMIMGKRSDMERILKQLD